MTTREGARILFPFYVIMSSPRPVLNINWIEFLKSLLFVFFVCRFEISETCVTETLNSLLPILAKILRPLIVFYTKEEVSRTIPKEYMNFKNLRCIIDCTEFQIQKPKDLKNQAATWSEYKHNNTVKCLVAITPQGSICYISELYAGSSTDKFITKDSRFLDYINPNDKVMADRGFPLSVELLARHAELVIPPAAKGTTQMTSKQVTDTKRVANVRIHVERVIRRLKVFRILSSTLDNKTLRHANDILFICAALTNLQPPIVSNWTVDD